jgi:hypothetical protein
VRKSKFTLKIQPIFSNGTLEINATKSLFSSDLTKDMEIDNANDHNDNDMDLDPKEAVRTIMQQCLELESKYSISRVELNGTNSIFKIKNLARKFENIETFCYTYTTYSIHLHLASFFSFAIWDVGLHIDYKTSN